MNCSHCQRPIPHDEPAIIMGFEGWHRACFRALLHRPARIAA